MNLKPARLETYDAESRTCEISIQGITDGGDSFLPAELCYPLGDKSHASGNKAHHTEIELKRGDPVWVTFIDGDPRFPVIIGYRPTRAGNEAGIRRWHHANIELSGDESVTIKTGGASVSVSGSKVSVDAGSIELNGSTSLQGKPLSIVAVGKGNVKAG